MDDRNFTSPAVAGTVNEQNRSNKQTECGMDTAVATGRYRFVIPSAEARKLAKAAQVHGIELASLLLVGFQWTLFQYTRKKELVPSNPEQSFLELARNLPCQDHVMIDLGRVQMDLKLIDFPKSQGSPFLPECRVRFVFDDAPVSGIDRIDDFDRNAGDLCLSIRKASTGEASLCLRGEVHYRTDLWDQKAAERFLDHLLHVLENVSLDARSPISGVSILRGSERDQLIYQFNDTKAEYPKDQCVHELFELQVERTPDAVALIFGEQQLTYSGLNDRANRLARYLRSQGVESQAPVGLCVERSFDLVVSILGILKAGGTYVPLDADYPADRLGRILDLAKIRHLVTQASLLDRLPLSDCLSICVDRDAHRIATYDSTNLGLPIESKQLAYIMFTSGSTGEPKGVMIHHGSLVNLLCVMVKRLELSKDHHFLCGTNPVFDASVWELLSPLVGGAKLEILSKATVDDPNQLASRIEEQRPTHFQATPTRWQLLLHSSWAGSSNLVALCGGESISSQLLLDLQSRCKEVWNLYGPTETTCQSTLLCCASGEQENCIGRPISNTQVYVLDVHGEPVPIGVPGELFIGGDGLASGYLNRPDLTAERFVSNPFSKDAGSRLYRTGDLCRWRSDGNLEYLGRIDQQVKLRGYRIELGEIEAILSQQQGISQSVVLLREDRPGDKRLVAYYTSQEVERLSAACLREYLGSKLPLYMLPSAFVKLDSLPLTPSGKIDRRSLPVPQQQDFGHQNDSTPARNAMEEQLVQIWAEVLGIEEVGIHDNFFALGGHSLLAVKLFARVNDQFNSSLPLALVFQGGTIAQMASVLEERSNAKPIAEMIHLSECHAGPSLIVLPGLNGELLYARNIVDRIGRQVDVVGLQPYYDLRYVDVYHNFTLLAREYVKVILESQPLGPFRFVGYSYGAMLGFEIARQLRDLNHKVAFLGLIDAGPDPGFNPRSPISFATHVVRAAVNLPRWVRSTCGPEDRKQIVSKIHRRLRYWFRWVRSYGRSEFRFEDAFGSSQGDTTRRKILGKVFQGVVDYDPEFYSGKVTLFRAAIRPLFHSLTPDLGWSRLTESFIVHRVPGDHSSVLDAPSVDVISAVVLGDMEVLDTSTSSLGSKELSCSN